jgi:hypothetical protein
MSLVGFTILALPVIMSLQQLMAAKNWRVRKKSLSEFLAKSNRGMRLSVNRARADCCDVAQRLKT